VRHSHHHRAAAARSRAPEEESARHLRQRHQLVEGTWPMTMSASSRRQAPSRIYVLPALMISVSTLSACATSAARPPAIRYDDAPAIAAVQTLPAPAPVEIVTVPEPLPLPGQLKPLEDRTPPPEPVDPSARVNEA